MGKVKEPLPVKLVVGMISGEESLFEQAEKKLTQKFGLVDFTSSLLPFNCTDYYKKKMQINLKRKFISFTSLIDPARIVEIKLFTNQLEENFFCPHSKQRRLNLDPGYITLAKLVLATSKNFQHRIYLGKGIYAEITLRYKRGKGFTCWEWTYPDYRSKEYIEIFNHLREIYCHQVLQNHPSLT
ncbi:MAG: DUF4416 family protein [Clostridia bacterium]|jgi:hypothetical protein|nr:DUF4416 family protein [Clostridia bacterium]